MADLGEVGCAYEGVRARLTDLVRPLGDRAAQIPVPTCPEWTVHDVVAHVTGVTDDALAGRLEGVATEPWTARQVSARREVPLAGVLAEWAEHGPAFAALLDPIGEPGRQAVTDVVTHEHDVRCALGRPGARDTDAVGIAASFLGHWLVVSAEAAGVPAPLLITPRRRFGPADAPASVSLDDWELLRAATGRRSEAQLRSLPWSGDAEAVLPAFTYGFFRPAVEDVPE